MAKKTRRAAAQRVERPTSALPQATPQPAPERARPAASVPQVGSRQVDFSKEYHYVIGDLRKMGILAASMLVVLIALSFVIR